MYLFMFLSAVTQSLILSFCSDRWMSPRPGSPVGSEANSGAEPVGFQLIMQNGYRTVKHQSAYVPHPLSHPLLPSSPCTRPPQPLGSPLPPHRLPTVTGPTSAPRESCWCHCQHFKFNQNHFKALLDRHTQVVVVCMDQSRADGPHGDVSVERAKIEKTKIKSILNKNKKNIILSKYK